jgi:hypothetical protein
MIFVDTSAWYAAIIPSDENHAAAVTWLNRNFELLLTTDYIVDETLTLLRARGEQKRALLMGDRFFKAGLADIYHLTESDVRETWEVFRQYDDKEWSFTDCSSKVVIEKLGLAQAFAFDHHFKQFGAVQVVP